MTRMQWMNSGMNSHHVLLNIHMTNVAKTWISTVDISCGVIAGFEYELTSPCTLSDWLCSRSVVLS